VILRCVEHRSAPERDLAYLDVQVLPIRDHSTQGALITYTPVGHLKSLQDDLDRAQREVQTTYEELQSVVEELETTNEELQSTNEELETTNEELHSTNEELETMNEELQTTNEELSTVNAELRTRTAEVDAANRFLEAVLRTIQAAVVVVSPDLRVQAWNAGAEELWGLRADEVVGKHFLTLDIGLPVDELRPRIRDCLAGETDVDDVVIDAVNRRGRAVRCHVTVSPLLSRQTDPDGVMLVMVVEG
jgi:two-component system CheB/CheR fusion protein